MIDEHELCPRCRCCEIGPEDCDACGGEGTFGHDCGEDTCCCLDPEENVACDNCLGRGFFFVCIGNCDANGQHQRTPATVTPIRRVR